MNSVVIFYGSWAKFEGIIPGENCRNLTEMVMEVDADSRSYTLIVPDKPIEEKPKPKVENFIVGSNEYAGVREHVILNFANFLAKMDVSNLYLQNPPLSISTQIKKLYPQTETIEQDYERLSRDALKRIHEGYEKKIKGQNDVLMKLLQALFLLTTNNRVKPIVILFYGDTGLGKTETAQFVSSILGENIFRRQFSMFQNNQFATYLFGGAHYERSFAKELLDRESNVILIDEFDKANATFHSAFYQLFDEGIYEDQNYHLELSRSIIICTSNYKTEEEIKSQLGRAIFSRFDAVIKFNELSVAAKAEIASMQYERNLAMYSEQEQNIITEKNTKEKIIECSSLCSNAREIAHLVEDVFSLILLRDLLDLEE